MPHVFLLVGILLVIILAMLIYGLVARSPMICFGALALLVVALLLCYTLYEAAQLMLPA